MQKIHQWGTRMKIWIWKCALYVPFNSFAIIIPEGTGLRGFHCKWSLKSGVVILPCSIATDEYVFSHQHSAYKFSTIYNKLSWFFLDQRAMKYMLVRDNVCCQLQSKKDNIFLQDILYYMYIIFHFSYYIRNEKELLSKHSLCIDLQDRLMSWLIWAY